MKNMKTKDAFAIVTKFMHEKLEKKDSNRYYIP